MPASPSSTGIATGATDPRPAPGARRSRRAGTAAWLAAAAVVSIVYQGFDFGINNNASHLAIVDRFRDPGLFPGNAFIDALENYCTAIWWLVKRATFVEDFAGLFFALHVLARGLSIVGAYLFLRLIVPGRAAALTGAALMAVSGALQNFTPVSRSDVFITYANHTSLAIALVLLGFVAALRAHYGRAMIWSGFALNCNVFMGIWAGGVVLAHQVLAGRIRCRRGNDSSGRPLRDLTERRPRRAATAAGRESAAREESAAPDPSPRLHHLPAPAATPGALLRSALVFLLVGAPVIAWAGAIMLARHGEVTPAPYVDFLRDFFPYHYFIEASVPRAIATCLFTIAAGTLAITQLERRRDSVALLFTALVALFTLGVAAPLVASHGVLMDLQLMRTETFIDVLAFLVVIAAAMQAGALASAGREVLVLRIVAACCVVTGYWPGALLGLAFGMQSGSATSRSAPWPAFIVGVSAVVIMLTGTNAPELYSPRLQLLVVALGAVVGVVVSRSTLPAFFPLLLALNYAGMHEIEGAVMLCMLPWFAGAGRPLRVAGFSVAGLLALVCIAASAPLGTVAFTEPGSWLTPRRGLVAHRLQILLAALVVWAVAAGQAALLAQRGRSQLEDAAVPADSPPRQARSPSRDDAASPRMGVSPSPRSPLALRLSIHRYPWRPTTLACAALLAFVAPAIGSVLAYRLERGSLTNLPAAAHELRSVEQWIASHLPRDAVVLIGFKHDTFSVHAKRNYWWGMKYGDGVVGNHLLAAEFAYRKRWQRRFQDQPLADTEPLLLEFAPAHGVTHVLVTQQQRSESGRLRPIQASERYILYEIPGVPEA